jgi:hypothetical protein
MSVAEQDQYTDNSGIDFLQQVSIQEEFVSYSCKLGRSKLVKESSPLNYLNNSTIQCNIHEVIYFIVFTYSAYVGHLQRIYIKRDCFNIIIYNSFLLYYNISSSYKMCGIINVVLPSCLLSYAFSIAVHTAVTYCCCQ